MYARHYKSYRRLNGLQSRRGEGSSKDEEQSNSPELRENPSHRNIKAGKLTASAAKKNNVSGTGIRVSTRNHQVQQNGVSRGRESTQKGPSPPDPTPVARRSPSRRIHRLMLKRKSQQRYSTRRSKKEEKQEDEEEEDEEEEEESKHVTPPKKEDKGKGDHHNNTTSTNNNCNRVVKRRSALWVLNCEAESFLFGETAAEKHEVELPPLAPPSPPPPKKRRWRVNELGALLEKSPGVLESKLRKSSSSESGTDMPREGSPPRKRLTPDAQRSVPNKRLRFEKEKSDKKTSSEMCSSKAVKCRSPQQKQEQPPPSPPQPEEEQEQEQQQQQEEEPSEEKVGVVAIPIRPELLPPIPLIFPDVVDHEAKTVQFHQMLSGLDFGYSFERPPKNDGWYSPFEHTTDKVIPFSSFEHEYGPKLTLPYEMDKPLRRSRTKPTKKSESKEELGAVQYVLDSINLLSDPYVVAILAGDDPDALQQEQQQQQRDRLLENDRNKT